MARVITRVLSHASFLLLAAASVASAQSPPATTTSDAQTGASAPQSTAAPATTVSDWLKQPTLFGNWKGFRTRAKQDYGTTFDVSFTQFFSWVPTIVDTSNFEYGNKLDARVNSDLGWFAWKGLSAAAHLELRAGTAPLLAGGTLIPTNTALLVPAADGTKFRLTSLNFTQVLNSHVSMSAGRFSALDLYSQDRLYTGGLGLDRFMNLSYNRPPIDLRTVPPVFEGITFAILKGSDVVASAGLVESTDGGFFKNGATVLWNVALPLKLRPEPGHYTFGGTFSSTVATSLDQSPWVFFPNPPVPIPVQQVQGAWTLNFTFDQALFEDHSAPERTMGVFGMIGISDGNPSPFQPYLFLGFAGDAYTLHRPHDSFGVGYYNGHLSSTLINTLAPFIRIRKEQGGELYYNFALAGWMKITADLQFVDPFAVGSKTRTFFSLRWKIDF